MFWSGIGTCQEEAVPYNAPIKVYKIRVSVFIRIAGYAAALDFHFVEPLIGKQVDLGLMLK
jgi:hypothetical protein